MFGWPDDVSGNCGAGAAPPAPAGCGRATTAVAQLPTQCSLRLCAVMDQEVDATATATSDAPTIVLRVIVRPFQAVDSVFWRMRSLAKYLAVLTIPEGLLT